MQLVVTNSAHFERIWMTRIVTEVGHFSDTAWVPTDSGLTKTETSVFDFLTSEDLILRAVSKELNS